MKKLALDHNAKNLIKAFNLTEKKAKAIDTYVSLSLQKTGQKISETFAGAIETGVIRNRQELVFMALCVGTLFERKTQQLAAKQYIDELKAKQNESSKPQAGQVEK